MFTATFFFPFQPHISDFSRFSPIGAPSWGGLLWSLDAPFGVTAYLAP